MFAIFHKTFSLLQTNFSPTRQRAESDELVIGGGGDRDRARWPPTRKRHIATVDYDREYLELPFVKTAALDLLDKQLVDAATADETTTSRQPPLLPPLSRLLGGLLNGERSAGVDYDDDENLLDARSLANADAAAYDAVAADIAAAQASAPIVISSGRTPIVEDEFFRDPPPLARTKFIT